MKPIVTYVKRPRPAGQEPANPPSKRQRTAQAASTLSLAQTALSALSAPHQEMLRVLQHHFQRDIRDLDLSMLDPATVQSLPFSMAKNWVGKVRSLTLPDGMQCLPLICDAMPELQALHVPGFNGKWLDLSSMRSLRMLTGSAGSALREIHLPINAEIDFRSDQKLHKLRVWRYREGQAVQQHPLPSHTYFKTLPGRSVPDFSEINFKAQFAGSKNMIVCRHLSQYVLEQLLSPDFDPFYSEGYCGLLDANMLPQKILPVHETNYVATLMSSKHYHFIDDASFANWVCSQFKELDSSVKSCELHSHPMNIKKGFLALSSNHAMVCMLAIKPGFVRQYVVVMFDPNDGLMHQRQIATSIEEITKRKWCFTNFLIEKGAGYFARVDQPLLCLIEPEQRDANAIPTTHYAIETSSLLNQDLLAIALDTNHSTAVEQIGISMLSQFRAGSVSAQAVFNVLQGRKEKNFPWYPAINVATNCKNPQMVTIMMTILKDFALAVNAKAAETGSTLENLPADFCLQLLKSAAGWEATPDELCWMNNLALEELCNKTLDQADESLITGEQAASLLAPVNAKGLTCLGVASANNHPDKLRILGIYLTALQKKGVIDFEHCLILLGSSTTQSVTTHTTIEPLILEACKNGWDDLLAVYADLLINLANFDLQHTELSWLLMNNKITEQIMGPVSTESVESMHRMLWAQQDGQQLRTSLEAFLVRLTNAGVLDPGNVLSHLCGSFTSVAPSPAPKLDDDQYNFFPNNPLSDDGEFLF